MRRLLASISLCFIGVSVSHAEELSPKLDQILVSAIMESKTCGYTTLKAPLNEHGDPKRKLVADENKEGRDILKGLIEGDKDYWRAVKTLVGHVHLMGDSGMLVRAKLPQGLSYRAGFIRIQSLELTLAQVRSGKVWFPTHLEVEIKYRIGWLITKYEIYRTSIQCITPHP